jgi:HAD superfamily hydrolase (TIGR01450 family)
MCEHPRMSTTDAGRSPAEALAGTRAFLLDLDGVVVYRGEPLPGAAEALVRLESAGIPYAIVTNISLQSRATISRELGRAGMVIPPERIVSASSAAAAWCRRRLGAETLYVLGTPDALTEFAGLRLLGHDEAAGPGARAAAVVVGDAADDFVPRNLQSAFTLLRGGARLVAMHRNGWWITSEGPRMDSGAYVVALEFATGRRAFVTGKPSRPVYVTGLEILGALATGDGRAAGRKGAARTAAAEPPAAPLLPGDVVMVGDDPWNDLRGAQRLGLRTAFVRSGKYGDAELARYSRERGGPPDAVTPSIVEIVDALVGRAT